MPGVFRPGAGGSQVEVRGIEKVSPPEGFSWGLPFNIWRHGDSYGTDFQAVSRIGGPTFYVGPGGSGNGSSPEAALPSVKAAIAAINTAGFPAAQIVVAPGKYVGGWGEVESVGS